MSEVTDQQITTLQPQVAKVIPVRRVHHGDTFVDNYEWLRAKEDPEVLAYLKAQNDYTEASFADQQPRREKLFAEIKERTKETDLSMPARNGQWWYFSRTYDGLDYALNCRLAVSDSQDWTPPIIEADSVLPGEQVILDSNELAKGHDFFSIGTLSVSDDGQRLLYGIDTAGDERYTLYVKDLQTGQLLGEPIENTGAGAELSKCGNYIFYTVLDEAWRPYAIYRHKIGDPVSQSAQNLVYQEDDEGFWVGIAGLSASGDYFMFTTGSKTTDEIWYAPASDPEAAFQVIWARRKGVEYSVSHANFNGGSWFVITHNLNSPDFEAHYYPTSDLDATPLTLLPARPGFHLNSVAAFARHLVVNFREDGLTKSGIFPIDTTSGKLGDFKVVQVGDEIGTTSAGASDWEQPTLLVAYTSMISPASIYSYDPLNDSFELLKQKTVLGGFSPDNYAQTRLWAQAEDGRCIPITLAWKPQSDDEAGLPKNRPTVLYGYGSYESSIDPYFSVPRLSMLDRGVVFAIAHIRGGGELGRYWYEEGKALSKKNTFYDFIASAKFLIAEQVVGSNRIVASGGSAGGLLVGAVANLAPELFAGIEADVPFVDPLTSILNPDLPLTVIEWEEWGNPLADSEVYEYMKSYSPYENVSPELTYPPILATTSLNDTRVLYVEPAKWVSRLQASGAPAFLKIELNAGHGGVSGRYDQWREIAWQNAWILDVLKVAES